MDDNLQNKLDELAELELKHGVTGVSFALKKGHTVTPEETVDHVMDLIKKSAELIKTKDKLKKI